MFDIGEKVMIEVEVADIVCKKGEVKYSLKDPLTAKCFDYLYTDDQIIPCEPCEEEKKVVRTVKTKTSNTKTVNKK